MDEAPHLAGLFLLHELERVELLDLGGKAHGVTGEIEVRDLAHAAPACQQSFPDFGGRVAYAADQTDAGDDDAPSPGALALRLLLFCHGAYLPFWFFSM